jgi:chemotaxis protein CheD
MAHRIFVNPGGNYFGSGDVHIETLLGSCVAIVFWHPDKNIGGLCHYLLPVRGLRRAAYDEALDGKYGEEAILQMLDLIKVSGTHLNDYVVKVFGGASILNLQSTSMRVGMRNIRFALAALEKYGVPVASQDLSGDGYRYLRFDVLTGDVWIKRGSARDVEMHL